MNAAVLYRGATGIHRRMTLARSQSLPRSWRPGPFGPRRRSVSFRVTGATSNANITISR